jgi:hypothetical protein
MLWVFAFVLWMALISGIHPRYPGLYQLYLLKKYLAQKSLQLQDLELQMADLQAKITSFQKDPLVRKFEVQKNTGYVTDRDYVIEFVR